MTDFSLEPHCQEPNDKDELFSLDRWQELSDKGEQFLFLGAYKESKRAYLDALEEAQKLIDDVGLSAGYKHSPRLWVTACYNLVRAVKPVADKDTEYHYLQLAHGQLQQFANRQELEPETRQYSLKMLDITLVSLLEFYQHHGDEKSEIMSKALIDEHVAFMAEFEDQNLEQVCEHCACNCHDDDEPVIH